jgi:hypothetical protein
MRRSNLPVPRWRIQAKPARFHQSLPNWRIVARAVFELIPDYSERLFLNGDNVRLASCSLTGYGCVHFDRPLRNPVLRAYTKEAFGTVQLLEVTQYGATFKTVEWPLDTRRIEEIIFESQQ